MILSGCISWRIKTTLDSLISDTQTGFMKGRYICENTHFIYDIMSQTEINNQPGWLVLTYFEKAFVYKILHIFDLAKSYSVD